LQAVLESTKYAAGLSADELKNLAASMQSVTTFGDEAVIQGESLLLTFTNIGKDVFPAATQTMLDMSTALGQDMKSSAIQLGKALNDPVAGVTALSRVGVSFTQQQKDQIKVLVETGDTLGAQKLILAELNKEFGGAAQAAASTYSGSMKQLRNAVGDLGEVAGAALLPVLTDMAKNALPLVTEATKRLAGWLGENLPAMIERARAAWNDTLLPAIRVFWAFTSQSVLPRIRELASWLGENVPIAIATLHTFWKGQLQPALKALWEFTRDKVIPKLKEFSGWLGEKIPVAIAAARKFWVEKLKPSLKALWKLLKEKVIPTLVVFAGWLGEKIPIAIAVIKKVWDDKLKPVLSALWVLMRDRVLPKLMSLAIWLRDHLPAAFRTAYRVWTGTLKPALEGLAAKASTAWNKIKWLIDKLRELKNMIGSMPKMPSFSPPAGTVPGAAYMRRDIPGYDTPSYRYAEPTYSATGRAGTMQFVYAPVVSAATRREVEQVLTPALDSWYRNAKRRRV